MTKTHKLRRVIAPWLVVAALASTFTVATLAVLDAPREVSAAGETITATFYVPLFEDNARAALFGVNNTTGTQLSSTTSLTIAAPNTVIYYDHWESGVAGNTTPTYDPTPNAPAIGSSTLVFGDGNTANGNAATYCVPTGCAGDIMPVGAVLRLNNSATITPGVLDTPRLPQTVVFDGRDRISSTDPIAVTHATWPTAINALHSEMAAAFDTSRWGVNFVAPVGTNTANEGSGVSNYSYAAIEIMAKEANTQVFVDANKDGDYLDAGDVNGTTIGEGQYVYVPGVVQGATANTTKPTQVFMMTGRVGSNFEDRSYQVFPTEGLVNDYTVPASTARDDGTNEYATVLYIHNPQTSAITVTVQTSAGSTNYNVAAGSTLTPAPWLTTGQTARVTSTATFAIFAGSGTRQQPSGGNISQDYDWGFSPVPARLLLDSVYVGWAPGSQDLTAPDNDVVWVTTLSATTVYVDYDGNAATGTFVDPAGGLYDVAYPVTALSQLKITDTTDNDMTGAHIYTVDGVGLATAYGEDPKVGNEKGTPGIDLGTTMFPACGALCTRKTVELAVDQDGDGHVDPGDTLQWTTKATNTDYYNLINPWLSDTLPTGLTYVPGTTTIVVNSGLATPVPDDAVGPAATLFPFDESGRQIAANIPVDGSVTIRYKTVVDLSYAGSGTICNRAIITSVRETILAAANGASTSCVPVDGLRLTKTSNSGGNPLAAGQALAYTLTVSNATTSTISNIVVTDPLPAGLNWVSTSVTRPAISTVTNTYADDFATANWQGSTGSTAWSDTSWTDSEDTSTTAGFLRKITDLGDTSAHFRPSSPVNLALTRQVGNLSTATAVTFEYEYHCNLDSGDEVQAQVRPTNAAAWVVLATYNTCSGGTSYIAASHPLTSGQWGASTQVRFIVTNAFSGGGGDDFWIDNVVVTTTAPGGRVVSTVPGAAPPNLVTLTDLLAGETATIVVNTTVRNPYDGPAEPTNFAMARSGNQVAAAQVVDCVLCYDYGDDPATYEGAGGTNPARAVKRSLRNTFGDTFQTGNFAGSTGSADFTATSWAEVDTGGAGPTAGFVQNVADGSERSARFGDGASAPINTALSRVLGDLSSYSSAKINVAYRCNSLEADDVIKLQVRPNGSAAWTDLQLFTNCNGVTYSNQILDLPTGTLGTATEVRFIVTTAFDAGDNFFVNDVQVMATADNTLPGPRLGTNADREVGGAGGAAPVPATPPAAPIGDDSAGGTDDEDGVALPPVNTNTLQIPITVTNSNGGAAYVNGWLDWNNNHVFDPGESIFDGASFVSATGGMTVVSGTGLAPAPGTYTVTVNVPALDSNGSGYTVGSSVYTRFRVATLRSEVTSPTGTSTDGEVEDFATTLNTLPVNLAHITSTRSGDAVTVDWRTAQEVDNLGFNVYAAAADGSLVQLNGQLVPTKAPTSVVPQSYRLAVTTTADEFWLEDVSLDGVPSLHGPYRVGSSYGDPNPPAAIDWASKRAANDAVIAANREASRRQSAGQPSLGRSPATFIGPVAQLAVTQAGVQRVTYEQLAAAGIDLAGVKSNTIAVTDSNGPVAIEVLGGTTFGAGSAVQFVGAPLDTLYTGTNVYWLHLDRKMARRIAKDATAPSAAATPVTAHVATTTVNDNNTYSVTAPGGDPWYDEMLFALGATPASGTATVNLDAPVAGQPATVSVELWGVTRTPVADEHHVQLVVNGVPITDLHFDDGALATLQGTVPAGVLTAGDNTLQVNLLTDTGVFVNIVLVNTWKVEFQRQNVGIDGRLDLTAAGQRIDASGVGNSPIVYRIAADGSITRLTTAAASGSVQVPATANAARYVFSQVSALRTPAISPMRATTDLLGGSADYIMVTNGVLTTALAPLVAYHQSLGRTVKVVDVADVYQAYSHGNVDAKAIDAYLAAAVPALGATWVLLAGSDSSDYRNFGGSGSFSLVPSLYGPLGDLITYAPLDPAYADTNADGVPDVALGRLPARTADELTMMIDKTLAYAQQPQQHTAVLASDANDGIDYAAVNDGLEAQLSAWTVRRADVDRLGVDDAKVELLDALQDGTGLAMYLGHSSSQEWTELGLFGTTDAAGLTGPPTAVAQFGCWNTYYVNPEADTLAHALMLDPDGGAAVVMGSATLTSAATDIGLAKYLIALISTGQLTIGEAVLAAKQALYLDAWGPIDDTELGWTILGDPAIVVGGAA